MNFKIYLQEHRHSSHHRVNIDVHTSLLMYNCFKNIRRGNDLCGNFMYECIKTLNADSHERTSQKCCIHDAYMISLSLSAQASEWTCTSIKSSYLLPYSSLCTWEHSVSRTLVVKSSITLQKQGSHDLNH